MKNLVKSAGFDMEPPKNRKLKQNIPEEFEELLEGYKYISFAIGGSKRIDGKDTSVPEEDRVYSPSKIFIYAYGAKGYDLLQVLNGPVCPGNKMREATDYVKEKIIPNLNNVLDSPFGCWNQA